MRKRKTPKVPVQAPQKIEICYHRDGRFWVRVDGSIVLEAHTKAQEARGLVVRDKGGTVVMMTGPRPDTPVPVFITVAIEEQLGLPAGSVFPARLLYFDHPQFVRPYGVPA